MISSTIHVVIPMPKTMPMLLDAPSSIITSRQVPNCTKSIDIITS